MSQAIEKIIWTMADLEIFPDTDDKYYEVIDGDLFVTRSFHRKYQQICVKIATQLENWCNKTDLGETIIALGMIFYDTDSVILDVV